MAREIKTIDELEAMLNSEDNRPVKINPDGTITEIEANTQKDDRDEYGLSAEEKQAWRDIQTFSIHSRSMIADALQNAVVHVLATAMEDRHAISAFCGHPKRLKILEHDGYQIEVKVCDDWIHDDWLAAARKHLEGK